MPYERKEKSGQKSEYLVRDAVVHHMFQKKIFWTKTLILISTDFFFSF